MEKRQRLMLSAVLRWQRRSMVQAMQKLILQLLFVRKRYSPDAQLMSRTKRVRMERMMQSH